MFRSLDPTKIIGTLEKLERRIRERFPAANLGKVAQELLELAREAAKRSEAIARPNLLLRTAIVVLLLGLVVLGVYSVRGVRLEVERLDAATTVQVIDGLLSEAVYVGLGVVFLFSLENRLKRRRALAALHELRSFAHIVDMHQLTKDPEAALADAARTPSSPERTLTRHELSRYLDYCSELLSLIGKVSALYAQGFKDAVAQASADELESLTTSLSRKIWQKIALLGSRPPDHGPGAVPAVPHVP